MNKKYTFLIPLSIILSSFLLRLSLISKGPYHLDCLNLAIKSQLTLDTGVLQNLFGPGYPLTVILGAFFIFLGRLFSIQDPVIMVNFMSVVFSSLAVGLLYIICRNEFDSRTGIFASLLFSITPIFLGISVYGKSHAPSTCFLLASIYFLLQNNKNTSTKKLVFSAIFLGFMGACRVQDALLMVPAMTYLLFLNRESFKKNFFNMLVFWAIAGFVVILYHLPYVLSDQNPFFKKQFSHFWGQGVTHSFRGILSPALLIAWDYFLRTLTPLGIMITFFGLFFSFLKDHKHTFFLVLWFFVPLFFYGNLYTIAPRYFAFSIAPLFIFQGYVLSVFFTYKPPYKIIAILLFLSTAYMSFGEIYAPLAFRHKNALLPEYAQWVKSITEDNAIILIGSDHGTFMKYYGGLNVKQKPNGRFLLKDEELLAYKKDLDDLLDRGIPLYISLSDIHCYDLHKQFEFLFNEFYELETVGGHYNEFWHKGSFSQIIYYETLFRLHKK